MIPFHLLLLRYRLDQLSRSILRAEPECIEGEGGKGSERRRKGGREKKRRSVSCSASRSSSPSTLRLPSRRRRASREGEEESKGGGGRGERRLRACGICLALCPGASSRENAQSGGIQRGGEGGGGRNIPDSYEIPASRRVCTYFIVIPSPPRLTPRRKERREGGGRPDVPERHSDRASISSHLRHDRLQHGERGGRRL